MIETSNDVYSLEKSFQKTDILSTDIGNIKIIESSNYSYNGANLTIIEINGDIYIALIGYSRGIYINKPITGGEYKFCKRIFNLCGS